MNKLTIEQRLEGWEFDVEALRASEGVCDWNEEAVEGRFPL